MRWAVIFSIACGSSGSRAPDAATGQTFSCEATTCSVATQYCYAVSGGVAPVAAAVGCNDVPAACEPTPDCACVMANATFACALGVTCSVTGGAVTVACANP